MGSLVVLLLAECAPWEGCEGAGRPFFLFAEPPRYSGGRSMRAVKNNLPTPSGKVEELETLVGRAHSRINQAVLLMSGVDR
jgi:hypothetical protein